MPSRAAAGRACARVPVKVITVYRDEAEVNSARPGENLRLRVQGIEEEDVSAGGQHGGRGGAGGVGAGTCPPHMPGAGRGLPRGCWYALVATPC